MNVAHLIFEHNEMVGTWEGPCWYLKYGWHVFHSKNTERHNYVGDREGFTCVGARCLGHLGRAVGLRRAACPLRQSVPRGMLAVLSAL